MSTLSRFLIVLVLLMSLSAVANANTVAPAEDTNPPAGASRDDATPPESPPSEAVAPAAAPAEDTNPPAGASRDDATPPESPPSEAAAPAAAPAEDTNPPAGASRDDATLPELPPSEAAAPAAAPAEDTNPPAGMSRDDATLPELPPSEAAAPAAGTINAVVVRSWSGCGSSSVSWDSLNSNWSSYGTTPIYIDYNYPGLCSGTITYSGLEASGADVVILSDPAGGAQQYSAAEIAAIKQYAQDGHALVGTFMLLQWRGTDNRGLAPLFGVKSGLSFNTGMDVVVAAYNIMGPNALFRGLPNPYVSSGYQQTQVPADGSWDAGDLSGGKYAAKTADNRAAIITYSAPSYRAVYITNMPELVGGAQDEQFLYNAIRFSAGTINAVVVRSWSGCGSSSVSWDSLNSNWSSYGTTPIHIDYNYPGLCSGTITYSGLVASGADVVILSNPAGGPQQYSAAEIAAIKQYAQDGHALVGTFMLLQWRGTDNRGLAPLFGVKSGLSFNTGMDVVVATYNIMAPNALFRGLPSPYVSSGYQQTQMPADGSWDAGDLSGGKYVAKTADNRAAIITYRAPSYRAVYITNMPEYVGGVQDEQFLYNAIRFSAGTINAVVVRSWSGCGSSSVSWDSLNSNWSSYGTTPIYIDYNYPGLCSGTITYSGLVASGADVVILSDPAGGAQQYSAAEIAAIKQYAQDGHALVGTYLLLQNSSTDNRGLAPLFGVKSGLSLNTGGQGVVATYNIMAPNALFRGLPSPYVSSGYQQTQVPADGSWDAGDLSGGKYVAKTADNRAAIITYSGPSYRAVYITNMPELVGGAQDEQFLYNAITYRLNKIFLPALFR